MAQFIMCQLIQAQQHKMDNNLIKLKKEQSEKSELENLQKEYQELTKQVQELDGHRNRTMVKLAELQGVIKYLNAKKEHKDQLLDNNNQ